MALDLPVVGSSAYLFTSPNEILDEIVCFLDPVSQRDVMSTCRLLHDIAARRLYRHIDVSSSIPGDRLLETLAQSKAGYAAHTRTLHYGSNEAYYTYSFHRLLIKALEKLEGLVHLSLHVKPDAFFVDYSIDKPLGFEMPMKYSVPPWRRSKSVKSFQLWGDIRLIGTGLFDALTKMTLGNKIGPEELGILLDAMASTGQNLIITELNLTVVKAPDDSQVETTLREVNRRCPNIEIFGLRTPTVYALDTTHALTLKPATFPKLRRLSINTVTAVLPYFQDGCQEKLLGRQEEHLVKASLLRPCLADVQFGTVKWTKSPESEKWRMEEKHTTQSEIEDSRKFPRDIGFFYLFWGVYYTL